MPTMGDVANAKSERTRSLVDALITWLFNIWESQSDFSDAGVAAVVDETVSAVEAALTRARQEEDAYQQVVLRALGKDLPSDLPPANMELYPRQDKIPEDVWSRPARVYQRARRDGKSPAEAKLQALKRVSRLAEDDIKLAQRERASRILGGAEPQGVLGYRRIIHPELSRTGTCGLCIVAADRIYNVKELYPLHDNCKCEVLPITSEHDPGLHLNRQDLDEIYRIAGGTSASKLSNTRLADFVSKEKGPRIAHWSDESSDGIAQRDRQYRAAPEDAQRYSEVSDAERMVRRARRSQSDLRRRGTKQSRKRESVLESVIKYWEQQATSSEERAA